MPEGEIKLHPSALVMKSASFAGSVTGGTQITKEMLEFAAKHKIEADVKVFPVKYDAAQFSLEASNDD